MRHPIRFGLIGFGGIGPTWAAVLADHADAELLAVVDTREVRRLESVRATGKPVFAQAEALLELPELDAVIVCTPPSSHAKVSQLFLDRGVPVLCEKPFALDATQARAMLASSQRSGALLCPATKFRFVEEIRRAKAIAEAGLIGELVRVDIGFCSPVDVAGRWLSEPEISGGGVFIDNGTHALDLLRYMAGEIGGLLVVGSRPRHLKVEDTVHVAALTARGVRASVDLSWSTPASGGCYLSLHGRRGCVEIGWKGSRVAFGDSDEDEWIPFGAAYDKRSAFGSQLENFCAAVRGAAALAVDAVDAVKTMEAIDAGYCSLRSGEWVEVPALDVDLDEAASVREGGLAIRAMAG